MKNTTQYLALQTTSISAAVRIIHSEGLYTLLTGTFSRQLSREDAIADIEQLLAWIEDELDVSANRLKGRLILPSSCNRYFDETFSQFSLAFAGISREELSRTISFSDDPLIRSVRFSRTGFTGEFVIHSLEDLTGDLENLQLHFDSWEEEAEAHLLTCNEPVEWYFFRDQNVNTHDAGLAATALGAKVIWPNTSVIGGDGVRSSLYKTTVDVALGL